MTSPKSGDAQGCDQRREEERDPNARQRPGQVGPDHVEGAVHEVEHTDHAEDDVQPQGQQDVDPAQDHPVEGQVDQLSHGDLFRLWLIHLSAGSLKEGSV